MENRENSKRLFKIFLIYFLILVAFVGVRIASNFGAFSNIENEYVSDFVATMIIQVGILFLLPFLLYICLFKKKPRKVFKNVGFKKLDGKAILICFGIGILAYIFNIFVSNFFSIILNYIGYNPTSSGASGTGYDTFPKFLYGVLSVAILPAICEEFVHRGILLRGTSKAIGYKKAIIISSILFGLMHMNISQFFYATILGILMGIVATMTRSIWPAIIMHFCNNFMNVFMSYAEKTKLVGFSLSSVLNNIANQSVVLFFIVSAIIVAATVFGIIVLLKHLFMATGAKRYSKMFQKIENRIRISQNGEMSDSDVVMAFQKYVFPNMKSPKSVFDLYIADGKHYGDISLKYKIPMVACFILAGLVTIFTFIWGVV